MGLTDQPTKRRHKDRLRAGPLPKRQAPARDPLFTVRLRHRRLLFISVTRGNLSTQFRSHRHTCSYMFIHVDHLSKSCRRPTPRATSLRRPPGPPRSTPSKDGPPASAASTGRSTATRPLARLDAPTRAPTPDGAAASTTPTARFPATAPAKGPTAFPLSGALGRTAPAAQGACRPPPSGLIAPPTTSEAAAVRTPRPPFTTAAEGRAAVSRRPAPTEGPARGPTTSATARRTQGAAPTTPSSTRRSRVIAPAISTARARGRGRLEAATRPGAETRPKGPGVTRQAAPTKGTLRPAAPRCAATNEQVRRSTARRLFSPTPVTPVPGP